MNVQDLTQTLVESFNALANEVQNLNDRQIVLEHKLRYAHEQFQYFSNKYAPAAPEISETLANLQLPPEPDNPSLANTTSVPLLRRKPADSKHQIALIIREGRRVASSLGNYSKSSHSSRDLDTLSQSTMTTATSTILEQDFTVEGKKSELKCPFSRNTIPQAVPEDADEVSGSHTTPDPTPHQSTDPICAAMFEETTSMPAPDQDGASKCPIRYMDQHSPEEIAHYLETHKHDLPRSHEVCLRRYQKNEDHIRKLDAKYGNLVNMVEGLGRIHQPMLPEQDTRPQSEVETGSNERVETWAQAVSATATDDLDSEEPAADDEGRQSHFDRPMKEVRLGESPSRPWGIPVPDFDPPMLNGEAREPPMSPPPAPVHVPTTPAPNKETPSRKPGKCPFDHTKLQTNATTPTMPKLEEISPKGLDAYPEHPAFTTPATATRKQAQQAATTPAQPTFLSAADIASPKFGAPQMVFTGPVFIGYPIEQAIQFMQHFQGQQ